MARRTIDNPPHPQTPEDKHRDLPFSFPESEPETNGKNDLTREQTSSDQEESLEKQTATTKPVRQTLSLKNDQKSSSEPALTKNQRVFNPSEFRKNANQTIDDLKRELYSSGVSPTQVSSDWQKARLAHDAVLAGLESYRETSSEEERANIEQDVRTKLALLRGEATDGLADSKQAIVRARPKEKTRVRTQKDSLQKFDTVFARTMKAESDRKADSAEVPKAIHTPTPDQALPHISSEKMKSGAFATDPARDPETKKESVHKLRTLVEEYQNDEANAFLGVQELADDERDTERKNQKTSSHAEQLSPEEQMAMARKFSPEEAARIYQTGQFTEARREKTDAPSSEKMSPEDQVAMARRFSPEEAARIYQSGETYTPPKRASTETGNTNKPEATPTNSVVEGGVAGGTTAKAPAYESPEWRKTLEKRGWGPAPDSIVTNNPILSRISMGGKNFKNNQSKGKETVAAGAVPTEKTPKKKKGGWFGFWNNMSKKKKKAAAARGALTLAGLAALLFLAKDKPESAKIDKDTSTGGRAPAERIDEKVSVAKSTSDAPPKVVVPAKQVATQTALPTSGERLATARAEVAKKEAPALTQTWSASGKVEQSWDVPFNNWEAKKGGHAQVPPHGEVLEEMARDTGYTLRYKVTTEQPVNNTETQAVSPSSVESTSEQVEAPQAPEVLTRNALGVEILPGASIYEDKNGYVYAYGGTFEERFLKAQQYAREYPGVTILLEGKATVNEAGVSNSRTEIVSLNPETGNMVAQPYTEGTVIPSVVPNSDLFVKRVG